MKHELAKQLKEAGYPQSERGEVYLWVSEKHYFENKKPVYRPANWKRMFTKATKTFVNEWIYIPTLSELIDACGEDFGRLRKIPHLWIADAHERLQPLSPFGATPEEAVAKLWLELNTKP